MCIYLKRHALLCTIIINIIYLFICCFADHKNCSLVMMSIKRFPWHWWFSLILKDSVFVSMRNNAGVMCLHHKGVCNQTSVLRKHNSNGHMSGFGKLESLCVIHSHLLKPLSEKYPLMKWTRQRNKPETHIFWQNLSTLRGAEKENENATLYFILTTHII